MSGKQIRGGVESNTFLSIRDTERFLLKPFFYNQYNTYKLYCQAFF